MNKILWILFSLVLIFSSKMFAAYSDCPVLPGDPDWDIWAELGPIDEDQIPTLTYPEIAIALIGVRPSALPQDPQITYPVLEGDEEGEGSDSSGSSEGERVDSLTANPPQQSGGFRGWLRSWWRRNDGPAPQVPNQRVPRLDEGGAAARAVMAAERYELDVQTAKLLQREEELEVGKARGKRRREEGSDFEERDAKLARLMQQQEEMEYRITDLVGRINLITDVRLLTQELRMQPERVDILTRILSANYLGYDRSTISQEGKAYVRNFITAHFEESRI